MIAGLDALDDAGVVRLDENTAIIQTVDFFTPIVDDPYMFGQVAAANSLSDVYAMGGTPLSALNILCYPVGKLDGSVLDAILNGSIEKLNEADTHLLGGHSVVDDELKYGLSVTGTVHPDKMLAAHGARPGDVLILTKPLGTGVIQTALKRDMVSDEAVAESVKSMVTLNRKAAECLKEFNPSACTDVTGFGLLGHALDLIKDADAGLEFYVDSIPLLKQARECAAGGCLPGGLNNNRSHFGSHIINKADADEVMINLICDAQTSGGLLITLSETEGEQLLSRMMDAGITAASIIGCVTDSDYGNVRLT